MNVLLTSDFKCSYFVDKDICQFLIIVWCVHRLWFIKDFGTRMGCEAFDGHEWWDADDWVKWVVVDKLSYEDSLRSVGLKSISSFLKIKLQKLIDVFCLIICFWMKDSKELNINVYMKTYLFSEIADKLRITIWYDKVKSTVFLIEFSELNVVYTDSINFLHKYKCNVFWETIHNNHHINADFLVGVDRWR